MTTKRDYYTPEQLAREYRIPKGIVFDNIRNKKLKVRYRIYDDNGFDVLTDEPPTDSRYSNSMSWIVMAEEAERFAQQYRAENNMPLASGAETQDTLYTGQKEIEAAFKAHGRPIKMRQITNLKNKKRLEIISLDNGKKKIPTLTESALRKFLYQEELKKNEK